MSGYPLRACLGVAVGRLGWPPESFWAATPVELSAALEARARAEGIDLRPGGAAGPRPPAGPDRCRAPSHGLDPPRGEAGDGRVMTTVEELNLRLDADLAPLRRKLELADAEVKRASEAMNRRLAGIPPGHATALDLLDRSARVEEAGERRKTVQATIDEQEKALEVLKQRIAGNEKLLPLLRLQRDLRKKGLALLPSEREDIEGLSEETRILERVVALQTEVNTTIGDAVSDLVVEGEKLSVVLKRIERDLINIILRKTALEPLAGLAGSGLQSITGSVFERATNILTSGLSSLFADTSVPPAIDPAVTGFDRGGAFRVGGRGGPDSIPVPLMLSPGELVDITPTNGRTGPVDRNVHIHPGAIVVNIEGGGTDTARFSATQIGQDIVEQLLPILQRL